MVTFVSDAMARATSLRSSLGYSHSFAVADFQPFFPEVNAPSFVFPFLVRARLPETLQFGRVCEEGRFLVPAAAHMQACELDFARFGMTQDGLHVWHVPTDGPGWVFDGK